MSQTQIPMKPEVSEKSLVAAMAEDVADAGYKVTTHTVKEDHERGERTLTVKFVRANPDQIVMDLKRKKLEPEDGN